MSGGDATIEVLRKKLDILYIIKDYIKSYIYMGSNFIKVIVLTDSSKINKDLLKPSFQNMYDVLYPHGYPINHSVIMYHGSGLKFLSIYNFLKKSKQISSLYLERGTSINLNGEYASGSYEPLTTTTCERLDININIIQDTGLIIKYIEIKDVDEAIFNTRMAIYNLTHREIELLKDSKSKSKEECCDKLESRLDRVQINLSRVEGMVRELEPTQIVHTQLSPSSARRTANNANKNSPRKTKKNATKSLVPRHLYYGRPELPE